MRIRVNLKAIIDPPVIFEKDLESILRLSPLAFLRVATTRGDVECLMTQMDWKMHNFQEAKHTYFTQNRFSGTSRSD
jgi:hypothetical protein